MTNVFLGKPSSKIIDFVKSHSQTSNGEYEKPFELSDPLCFKAEEPEASIKALSFPRGEPLNNSVQLEYSTDNQKTWNNWDGSQISLPNIGDCVYIRAAKDNATLFNREAEALVSFNSSNKLAVSGNVQTLLSKDGTRTDVPDMCFAFLFYNCTNLTSAPVLPATELGFRCYAQMFENCFILKTAPKLPATQLGSGCYMQMFSYCGELDKIFHMPSSMSNVYNPSLHGYLISEQVIKYDI